MLAPCALRLAFEIVRRGRFTDISRLATLFTTANLDIVMQALNAVNAEDGVKVDDAVSKQGVI